MSESLVLAGIVVVAVSGGCGLLFSRRSVAGQWLTTFLAVIGNSIGIFGVASYWAHGEGAGIRLPWQLPGAEFAVGVDGISALFLLPVFLISLLGSVYGLGYWRQTAHLENCRQLRLFYGLATAAMGLLLISRNGILFLASWEVMALAAYFLVTTEDEQAPVREAGWVYLIATHTATLCLFALFALWNGAGGSFELAPLAEGRIAPGTATAIFVLALVGFGVKAGVMPLHVWLPSAHAMAPSHVSALMSGVIIKMGIYGLVRVTSLLPSPPAWWGGIVLALGVISGVLGVAFAIAQHDLKRLLAYHSIENIGIILMGLGLALVGRSLGRWELVVLGMGGALLHVWNHALFKSLLFLSAGSVIHAVHTRQIDRLGGLSRAMPRTSLYFLVGAVAICGLPPLNGFVSEFLIYLGLFRGLTIQPGPAAGGMALAAPALALIGALALACFVKVYAAVFLGTGRSEQVQGAHESEVTMTGPMAVLAVCCLFIGLGPTLVAPALQEATASWAATAPGAGQSLTTLAPLAQLSGLSTGLIAAVAVCGLALGWRVRSMARARAETWGCGYAAPAPSMQYTSSSFAQTLVGLFGWVLRPREHRPQVEGYFPEKTHFHSEVPDVVLERLFLPAFRAGARCFSWFYVLHQGNIQAYLVYILVVLFALLLWQ
jgi:hydrogenase-4 component B